MIFKDFSRINKCKNEILKAILMKLEKKEDFSTDCNDVVF